MYGVLASGNTSHVCETVALAFQLHKEGQGQSCLRLGVAFVQQHKRVLFFTM